MTRANETVLALVELFEGARGQELTQEVSLTMARAAVLIVPTIPLSLMADLTYPKVLQGKVIDQNLIWDRARAIATVAMFQ